MEETFSAIPEQKAPKQRGCFFYGCIASIIMLVLIGVAIFLVYRFIGGKIVEFTEDAPRSLPEGKSTPEEQQAIRTRIADFDAAVKAEPDKPVPPLVLSADDINALIASDPNTKGKMYVTITGNTVESEVSWPLPDILGTKGRYLNGKAGLEVGFAAGSLVGHITSAEVKGKKVPDEYMAGFKGQNVFEQANKDPKNASKLARIEGLEVKDGKIIVKLKAKADAPAELKDEPKAEAPKVDAPKEEAKPEPPKEEPKAEAPKRAA